MTLRWLIVLVSLCAACAREAPAPEPGSGPRAPAEAPAPASTIGYDVVRTYPHDPDAFTQGLIFTDGVLYESTGLRGRSSLRRVRLETGEVLARRDVDEAYFAEGLTTFGNRLYQLTWTSGVAFVYDRGTFEPQETFRYTGEGWGLTHDGRRLIMSDGSSELRFLDPATFAEQGRVAVRDGALPVPQLNELEFVRGRVWANVWTTDRIAIIDPATGRVESWLNLAGLHRPTGGDDVLNGIAYDAEGDRLFVTGKLWRSLYQIEIREGAR